MTSNRKWYIVAAVLLVLAMGINIIFSQWYDIKIASALVLIIITGVVCFRIYRNGIDNVYN